ncbi:MAG TPA: AMMECR1 domain-containing protein, partial [Candidatus Angelobacter sp.]|nr:AMMECR1 domain-containing protein [Candidatus Angelobacter sp.]
EDVVRAALLTAKLLPQGKLGLERLTSSHIAVTFFSALEECTLAQLDNDRYGIVVCSRERSAVMGGALPRMPGIGNEFQQFQQARIANGKLLAIEPYKIYRHEVSKVVEPGIEWQKTGVPKANRAAAWETPELCPRVARRARDIAISYLLGLPETMTPLTDSNMPEGLHSLFVTIYIWGRLRGCMGDAITHPDADLRRLVLAAWADDRFPRADASAPEAIAVSVSFLTNPITLGEFSPETVVRRCVHGIQALRVYQNQREGMLLPFLAAMHDLNPVSYALEVIDKAGITRPPYFWQRFDCATWLADSENAGLMEGAFRRIGHETASETLLSDLAALYSDYIVKHQKPDGSFHESYEPFRNRLHDGFTPPRVAHTAWTLARAFHALGGSDLKDAAEKAIDLLLRAMRVSESGTWLEFNKGAPSVSEIAFLILAICEFPVGDHRRRLVRSLAETIWSCIDRHGRIATHRTSGKVPEAHQDYAPGQALLALAAAAESGLTETKQSSLQKAFRYYRHRFRHNRDFGQVSWMMQAFSRWWRIQPDPEFAGLVFEIGDWILEFQSDKNGGFMTGQQSDTPGFTTALYLEGIAAAVSISGQSKYLDAYMRGMQFLHRLTILPGHAPVLPNSEYATGGLRQSLYTSLVRLDFVQHALSAVLEQYSFLAGGASPTLTPIETTAAAAALS